MMAARKKTLKATTPAQRKALASPIRQEILGHFGGARSLSVADLAVRMGRPATALYYHVTQLTDLGLLEEAGERQKGKRYEVLYRPTAERYEIDAEDEQSHDDIIGAFESAQRMAIRDLKDALENDRGRVDGSDRNLIAFRLQGQIDPESLQAVNGHIDAILDLVGCLGDPPEDPADTDFISLTLALSPLRGRTSRSQK